MANRLYFGAGWPRGHAVWQSLIEALFPAYRPERHYMRGPGPKWHAKHDRVFTRRDRSAKSIARDSQESRLSTSRHQGIFRLR